MSDIAGYTYKADTYCSACILKPLFPSITEWHAGTEEMLDLLAQDRGIDRTDERTFDTDDFPKPFLTSSESGDTPDVCCGCDTILDTSFSPDCIDYVIQQIADYVHATLNKDDHRGNAEYLDQCCTHMRYYMLEADDDLVIHFYNEVRSQED